MSATLIKEWTENPPTHDISTLDGLVADFIQRFPRHKRDFVVPYCQEAEFLFQAILRAVVCRGEDGRLHHHQAHVTDAQRRIVYNVLVSHQHTIKKCKTFDQLLCVVQKLTELQDPVFVYDLSVRIGAWMSLEPEKVYLHAGVMEGAYNLGLISEAKEALEREELPLQFEAMSADMIEDFLCCMRNVFTDSVIRSIRWPS